jgi:hypothetical protein
MCVKRKVSCASRKKSYRAGKVAVNRSSLTCAPAKHSSSNQTLSSIEVARKLALHAAAASLAGLFVENQIAFDRRNISVGPATDPEL